MFHCFLLKSYASASGLCVYTTDEQPLDLLFLVRNALIHSFPVYIYLDKVRVSATTESVYIKAISLTRTHWVNRPQRYQKKRKSFCPLKLNLINLELLSDIDLSSGIYVSLFSYIF